MSHWKPVLRHLSAFPREIRPARRPSLETAPRLWVAGAPTARVCESPDFPYRLGGGAGAAGMMPFAAAEPWPLPAPAGAKTRSGWYFRIIATMRRAADRSGMAVPGYDCAARKQNSWHNCDSAVRKSSFFR